MPTPANVVDGSNVISKRRSLWFMAILCPAVVVALGTLSSWHVKLITRGETSVEAHINQSEHKRLLLQNKIYINPYNFGPKKNWQLFLGLVRGR